MPQAENEQRKDGERKRGRFRGGESDGGQKGRETMKARRISCYDAGEPLKRQNKLERVETGRGGMPGAGNVASGLETHTGSGPRRPGNATEKR